MKLEMQKGLFHLPKQLMWGFELLRQSIHNIEERAVESYGIVMSSAASGWSSDGNVTDGGDTTINVAPFGAVIKDADGMIRGVKETATKEYDLAALSDGTYKVLLQPADTFYEPGTITLTNGSTTVNGAGTEFTRNLERNLSIVILDSSEGNNGLYRIENVVSDTQLTLQNSFSGITESGLPYAIGGFYPDGDFSPADDSSHRIYKQGTYEIVITTAARQAHQYWLAEVVKSGSSLTITDKRAENRYELQTIEFAQDYIEVAKEGKPFTTVDSAISAAGSGQAIMIYPGIYYEAITLKDGVNLHFLPGAVVNNNIDDTGATITISGNTTCKITGDGEFVRSRPTNNESYVLRCTTGTPDIIIESKRMENVGTSNSSYIGEVSTTSGGNVTFKSDKLKSGGRGFSIKNSIKIKVYGGIEVNNIAYLIQNAETIVVDHYAGDIIADSTTIYMITAGGAILNIRSGDVISTSGAIQLVSGTLRFYSNRILNTNSEGIMIRAGAKLIMQDGTTIILGNTNLNCVVRDQTGSPEAIINGTIYSNAPWDTNVVQKVGSHVVDADVQ